MTRRERRCAFLTFSDPDGFVIDDARAIEPLKRIGWIVSEVPWDQTTVPWHSFDAVVIRSTWDYQHRPDPFLAALSEIERSGVPLFNSVDLVRWNHSKSYLQDLAELGIPVVPTVFLERYDRGRVDELFEELACNEIVLKPLVSASAECTFRLRAGVWQSAAEALAHCLGARALLAQPFVRSISEAGEYSLFYFDGAFSHSILKTPAAGDFRVQEEHGAEIRALPATAELEDASASVLAVLPEVPLYARVDLVAPNQGAGFWLMELELIEPSLYLRMDANAPRRFAEAFARRAG